MHKARQLIHCIATMDVINDLWTNDSDDDEAAHMKYYKSFATYDARIRFAIACRDVEGLQKLLEPGEVGVKLLEKACADKSAACLALLLDRCDDVPQNLVDICLLHREPACLAEVVKRVRPTAGQIHDTARVFTKETFVKLMESLWS